MASRIPFAIHSQVVRQRKVGLHAIALSLTRPKIPDTLQLCDNMAATCFETRGSDGTKIERESNVQLLMTIPEELQGRNPASFIHRQPY